MHPHLYQMPLILPVVPWMDHWKAKTIFPAMLSFRCFFRFINFKTLLVYYVASCIIYHGKTTWIYNKFKKSKSLMTLIHHQSTTCCVDGGRSSLRSMTYTPHSSLLVALHLAPCWWPGIVHNPMVQPVNENLMVDLGCILYVFTIIIYFDTALVINNLTCFMDG